MKKLFLFFSLVFSLVNAQYPFQCNENWKLSGITKPSLMGSGTERGIVYGNMGNGERLYVVSRNGGNKIVVLNPADGSEITLSTPFSFNVSGQNNQLLPINDIAISEDNKLFVSSVSSNSNGTEWYLHVATSEGGTLTRYDLTLDATNERVGDRIYVTGSWDAGTIRVYAPVAGMSSNAKIYKFTTTNQGTDWNKSVITLSGTYTNTATNATITVDPDDGGIWIAGNGASARKHDASGAYVANSQISNARITSSIGGIRFVKIGSKKYLITAIYRANPSTSSSKHTRFTVWDVSTITTTPDSVMSIAPLTTTSELTNSLNCNVAYKINNDHTLTVYILGTDEGIAAYTSSAALPVELVSFTAVPKENLVTLNWQTATEINTKEFIVERKIAENWSEIGKVAAKGNSNTAVNYTFDDNSKLYGKVAYRIKSVDNDGSFKYSDIVEVNLGLPKTIELLANYPNPFNPATTIYFVMPQAGNVTLKVYNSVGQEVATLLNGYVEAGINQVQFNAENLSSGVYFYRVVSDYGVKSAKMMLMK